MPELYLMFKRLYMLRVGRLLDVVLGHQNLVDALHRGQSLGYAVARFREFFQRIDDAVEYHHIINKGGAGDGLVVQYQHAAEPQHDDNHHRAQELTHRVGRRLADVHPHQVVAIG